jgi:hypothetical protein
VHGIGNCRGHGNHRRLSNAHAAVRTIADSELLHNGFQDRNILDRGNFVFTKVGRDHFAGIHHDLFHQSIAHPHYDAAVDLALMHQWVNHGSRAMCRR